MTTLAEELDNLYRIKQWYDLCLRIQDYSESNINDMLQAYETLILPNSKCIHPNTFSNTTLVIANLLPPQESQKILKVAMDAINQNEFLTEEMNRGLLIFEIRYFENKIFLKEEDGIERFIYEIKGKKMDKQVLRMYYGLCYKYYECKCDFEEAFGHLDKFIYLNDLIGKEINTHQVKRFRSLYDHTKEDLAYKHVKFALLNTRIYNFTAIMQGPVFEYLKDDDLLAVFQNIMKGDIEFVINNQEHIENIIPSSFGVLKEKVYLISFIDLCFYKDNKTLKVSNIQEHLKVERSQVFYIIMKALGLDLIKGTIDGDKDEVELDYVVPRVLNVDELREVKRKYENWKSKISDILSIME